MKTLHCIATLGLLAAFAAPFEAAAQLNSLTQTTLSATVTRAARVIPVASATGIVAPTQTVPGILLYVYDWGQLLGEPMNVLAVNGTNITVARTSGQTVAHVTGAVVLIGQPNWYYKTNPTGSCVTASTYVAPWVNTLTGEQWLCSTVTLSWVPGFQRSASTLGVNTLVASTAGLITPSGPLFHINGTAAITGFTLPVGYVGGRICVIPDAGFTTTTANNIAVASTGVAGKLICWDYDENASKPFAATY